MAEKDGREPVERREPPAPEPIPLQDSPGPEQDDDDPNVNIKSDGGTGREKSSLGRPPSPDH